MELECDISLEVWCWTWKILAMTAERLLCFSAGELQLLRTGNA